MSWRIDGYREAGLGTSDPDHWLHLFLEQAGWHLAWEGPAGHQPLWPTDAARPDHEWVLTRPGKAYGQLRLFRFADSVPAPRDGASTWDTGGIFDLDCRVRELNAWHEQLTALGWQSVSEPIDWPFGELQVREWLARGPDDVILALMQRLAPELPPDARPGPGLSEAFNSSQTVRDFEASLAFYAKLGFATLVRQETPLGGRGGEVIGLESGAAPTTPVSLAIVSPNAALEGSVELVALPDRTGRDLADACGPGMRGLNLLRFPTTGLTSLRAHLVSEGVEVQAEAEWELAPWGSVRGLALTSPDGAWLELIETQR